MSRQPKAEVKSTATHRETEKVGWYRGQERKHGAWGVCWGGERSQSSSPEGWAQLSWIPSGIQIEGPRGHRM